MFFIYYYYTKRKRYGTLKTENCEAPANTNGLCDKGQVAFILTELFTDAWLRSEVPYTFSYTYFVNICLFYLVNKTEVHASTKIKQISSINLLSLNFILCHNLFALHESMIHMP